MSLQVTVMIAAFVVATISPSVAFQTEPPPIFTTVPNANVTRPPCSFGGMQVEGLVPGSTVQEGCVIFTCDYGGYVERVFEHCSVLGEFLCVDPIHGKCCSTCPNGYNCRTPSDKIIKDGETVTEDGMICTCSVNDNWWDWDWNAMNGPEAQCTFVSTTPLPTTTG